MHFSDNRDDKFNSIIMSLYSATISIIACYMVRLIWFYYFQKLMKMVTHFMQIM